MLNKDLIRQRFTQALHSYDQSAYAQQRINQQLIAFLLQYSDGHFEQLFEIGCGTGHLTSLMHQQLYIKRWILNDLCSLEKHIHTSFPTLAFTFLEGDIETLPFPKHNDLIASASAIQWLENPHLFIQKCAHHLNPSGYLLLSTFTENNFQEIKALTEISLDYPRIADWQHWLSEDFELLVCHQEDWCLAFESAKHVLQHLKHTGVSGIQKKHWTPSQLRAFIHDYHQRFRLPSGEVSLCYSPLFLLARKK